LAAKLIIAEDVTRPKEGINDVSWIAPVFDNQVQVAVVGLGKPSARLNYSTDDLDLLAEVADRIGNLLFLNNLQQHSRQANQSVTKNRVDDITFNSSTDALMLSIAINPDAEFVKIIEDGLRHLGDYSLLGESTLANQLGVQGESHLERGKALYCSLLEAIETLRPSGPRPHEPLPRVWYQYTILHDAYVEEVPNREIMASLYISEGTFNRTRRNALRSLARLLLEKGKYPV
jgi:hypothetical protein